MKLSNYLIGLLTEAGFSETEALIYLAILKKPGQSLQEIEQHTQLSKATVYRIFEMLYEKKVVSLNEATWPRTVNAISIRELTEHLAKKQRQLGKTIASLRKSKDLQDLSLLAHTQEPIEILTNPDQATEQAYKIISQAWDTFLCFGASEKIFDVAGEKAGRDFISNRVRKGRKCAAIFTDLNERTKYLLQNNRKQLRQGKFMNIPTLQDSITYIHGNEITVWNNDPELGKRALVVKDPALVNLYKNQFATLWKK